MLLWLAVIKVYDLRLFSTLSFIAVQPSFQQSPGLSRRDAGRDAGIDMLMIILGALQARERTKWKLLLLAHLATFNG